jgi:hypothetical protein
MGPGAQDGGGDDRADSGSAEQVGSPGAHQGGEGTGVLGDLPIQELDPAGQRARAGRSGSVSVSQLARWRSRAQVTTSCWVVNPRSRPPSASGRRQRGRAAAVGRRWWLDRGAAHRQPCLERCPRPGCSWLGEGVTSQRFVGRPGGVQGSDLAPWRRAGRLGRSSSTTCRGGRGGTGSARRRSRRCAGSPTPAGRAAGRPTGAAAGSRPGAAGTVTWSTMAPVAAATTAAVWVCLWVSTPMTRSTSAARMAMR